MTVAEVATVAGLALSWSKVELCIYCNTRLVHYQLQFIVCKLDFSHTPTSLASPGVDYNLDINAQYILSACF